MSKYAKVRCIIRFKMKYRLLSILINNISVNPVLISDFHFILLKKNRSDWSIFYRVFFFNLNFQLHEKHFIYLWIKFGNQLDDFKIEWFILLISHWNQSLQSFEISQEIRTSSILDEWDKYWQNDRLGQYLWEYIKSRLMW